MFLHGYYEPTLLFLYEPLQTTAGRYGRVTVEKNQLVLHRASIRSDTVCMMGVSLNTLDQQHAIVWQLSGLPMDIYRCV